MHNFAITSPEGMPPLFASQREVESICTVTKLVADVLKSKVVFKWGSMQRMMIVTG